MGHFESSRTRPCHRRGSRWYDPGLRTRFTRSVAGWIAGLCLLVAACGDGGLRTVTPDLLDGGNRIWEVAAQDLPSAFDVFSGRRLFLGSGDIGGELGDIFVEAVPGTGELRLRSVASLLRLQATHGVEIQDLGPVDFSALDEVPDDDNYTESEDSSGAIVVPLHVYALRITRTGAGPNFAKLIVDGVGGEVPGRRFIDFRYVFQVQPGNRRFEEEQES